MNLKQKEKKRKLKTNILDSERGEKKTKQIIHQKWKKIVLLFLLIYYAIIIIIIIVMFNRTIYYYYYC